MGPRKAKDIIDDDVYWRICIEETPLNDDYWKVKVVLIEAAGSDQDCIYLSKFETYASEERRFVVKNICKTETVFMINQLGGEKKVKDDNLRVFEEGQIYLKEKKDVPPDIMALIIKHLILKMKEEYLFIQRQRLEVREGMKHESATMISKAEVKGTVNVNVPEPQDSLAPLAKGKGQEPIITDENKKYSTLLRVRGEEWRDKIYINDYPIDGPNLYIAVTGFLEPNLAGWLIKVGVPLAAIVQIRINLTSADLPSTLLRPTKRGQSQTDILAEKSLKFWEDLQQLRINKNSSDYLKNTAFIVFRPPYWNSESLSGCNEKIYDEICYLMYDIQDLTRQHIHYLDNMDVMTIPKEYNVDCFLSFYDTQIDGIPSESINIYFVLDAILKAVCNNHNFIENSNNSSCAGYSLFPNFECASDNRLDKSNKLVKEVIKGFRKLDINKNKYRVTNGFENEHKNPIIIDYGDFCKVNTFHLDNKDLDSIICSMLFGMPVNKLWQNRNKPTKETNAKVNFHVNIILSCFDRCDVETAELNRLLHILACRKLYNNRSSLKKEYSLPLTITEFKKAFLKRSILAEPLMKNSSQKYTRSASPSLHFMAKDSEEFHNLVTNNDDESCRIQFLFDCPDISELVSATEITNQKPISHMIDNYEYFEDFTGTSALQVLFDAFKKFNCIDYKYCEVTDCFIIMFYNSHDKEGISREDWRCHLPTPLCLQDFFDFVLEEHYDWIKNEENAYEDSIMCKSHSECKVTTRSIADPSCIEQKEIDLDLLIEGSLKYEEMANESNNESNEKSNSNFLLPQKSHTSLSSTDVDSVKSSRKTKSPALSIPKQTTYHQSEAKTDIKLPRKPFSAYDLGDRRVEIFGRDSSFFSKDGTRISTGYTLLIPANLEFLSLNIAPGNEYNEFWIHKVFGEITNPKLINACESIRITTKSQIIFYLKKEFNKVPIYPSFISSKHESHDITDGSPERFETEYFHSLSITWPNGLITETVHENNSSKISHIKQYYINPKSNVDEEMRCISLDGEVIIFKSNREIEILKPDSTYIKITKFEKRIVNEDIPESVVSATYSDKSKKGKNKPSKTSSKSSKRNLIEDETFPTKEIKYELFIDEFEIIDTNGLKQRWVEDKKINAEKLLIKTATDFCLGEIFSKRMDGTSVLLNKDGELIVTFAANNTQILTRCIIDEKEIYPEWTDDEKEYFSIIDHNFNSDNVLTQQNFATGTTVDEITSRTSLKTENDKNKKIREDGYISMYLMYTIEHVNVTTVSINKFNENISIESPNNNCVTFDKDNHYEFSLDKKTYANFDGEYLHIKHEACSDCTSYTNIEVKVRFKESDSLSKLQRNWLQMTDSFGKKVIVNEEGNVNIVENNISDERLQENSNYSKDLFSNRLLVENVGENITAPHNKCREMYEANSMKFFILKRDLTCSELVHRAVVEEYKEVCQKHPWCSINHYDSFGDHRSINSILSPVDLNEYEKWLMESKLSSKPKYLTYKDLKEDYGKGFYHWMRPYKRFKPKPTKPNPVIPDRLPRAFVLRTFEKQWNDSEREQFKGAKELLNAILRYRNRLEADSQTILNIPIQDRSAELKTHEKVQALAHRIYIDLKDRLEKDVQSRAKSSITTKPLPADTKSLEEEFKDFHNKKKMAEDEKTIKEAESAEAISPNLKRYWRRRAEEYKEEQFYRYLLREGSVPPYFRNVLGGSLWWDMSKAADNAVANAEKGKMKCVCYED